MTESIVNLSTVNFKTVWGNKQANLSRILSYSKEAADAGADMIVFPELALTGYDDEPHKEKEQKMQTLLAEPVPGPSSRAVAALSAQTGAYILFGMPERDAADPLTIYNTAVICCPDGRLLSYRKAHIPFGEVSWASAGERALLLETCFGRIGIGICYDTYKFPEMVRYTKAMGGQLFINVTALPFEDILPCVNRDDLETLVLENSVYIANANLVGLDLVKHFMGGSCIMGPTGIPGRMHYYAGYPFGAAAGQHPGICSATIDLSIAAHNESCTLYRTNPLTNAPDWRPEIYRAMCRDVLMDGEWQRKVCEK
ncbi:carbon-nitrogen hydrolase family protein [Agathobaculum sp. NTUH-O15-33]|uniref:carbon-nitrogen hydrolase family protein n=1 Tax=Agathobaculum sp. NTUH-O15-33 TaxID=3079302 RepID=UPI002958D1FC|nr:carbon-nitrogen hydrolase family protein [Agathobaculum sp. NTUH-O15-33]WNX84441.1 carbon-nitrogen hydrolase family protein [Agathobaculum sp. NTUH-O15-33]